MNRTKTHFDCATGFTLVEMVTSMVILSILLTACGSIVAMASRAIGTSSTNNQTQQQVADASNQLTDDLNVALNFTSRSSTAVTFTVPDRLGLGTPQTVSYGWTGNAGDPLLRQFNGGTATTLVSGVRQLNLSFTTRLMGPTPTATEQVLFSHDAALGAFADYSLDNKNWGAQYFLPTLPVGATSYTLTRILMVLKCGDQSNALLVSLIKPDSLFRPTGATVAQTTVYESALSSQYEWINIPFTGLSGLGPLQPLCVVLSSASGSTNLGKVQVDQSLLNLLVNAYWSSTSNSGSSWTSGARTIVARMYVYGTVP